MTPNRVEIIHDDCDIIVINKPTGISVTADRSGAENIIDVLSRQMGVGGLRLVHRLDKDTSGVMVIARNKDAQSRLSRVFAKRTVRKTYIALVKGPVTRHSRTIRVPIARYRKDPRKMIPDRKRGKAAVTHYRMLADFGAYSLLDVQPETGRTHQIRAHLAWANLPLAIDPLYGSQRPLLLSEIKPNYLHKRDKEESPLIERLTLHAYELQIPTGEDAMTVYRASLDKKFAAMLKMLAKHNPRGIEAFGDPEDLMRILSVQAI
jgi:RluA family pseudouridine synthase